VRSSSADTASAWKSPRYASNFSCSDVNGRDLAITRHSETLGFFIPAQKRSRRAEIEAMRAAAKDLDSMIAEWGSSENELMREYREIRRASREKKRRSK
jgi:hypothetical protein